MCHANCLIMDVAVISSKSSRIASGLQCARAVPPDVSAGGGATEAPTEGSRGTIADAKPLFLRKPRNKMGCKAPVASTMMEAQADPEHLAD